MFQVNFTDRDGDSCWADFSSELEAELYVGQWGGEILSVEEFEWDEDDQWPVSFLKYPDCAGRNLDKSIFI